MSTAADPAMRAYAQALRTYLERGGEDTLADAFRVGRDVITRGKGVIDLVEVHADALRTVLPEIIGERGCVAASGDSCRFLAESLASFEMILLGARETNETLREMNQTLNHRVEQRARELERERGRFQEVIEHNPAALYALRISDPVDYLYVSPQVERLFGYSAIDWTPALATSLIHEDDRALVRAAREKALREGGQFSSDHRVRTREGETRFLQDRGHVVRSEDGECVLHGVITDVTEQVDLQLQLLHAQKMEAIGRLAGGVAHDFNNLLTVILSFGRLVIDDFAESDPRAEDVREILRAAGSAAALTNQLLSFSRRQVVEPRVLRPQDALNQLERMVRRTISDEVALVTRYEPDCGQVRIDPGQLDQVVLNLILNACDAMREGGTLRLGLKNVTLASDEDPLERGEYVELSVADTGSGMAPEVSEHIFEPFFTTKGTQGTGLGLSTCFGIVRQAGGDIRVETAPGRGTCMRVLLPRVCDEDEAAIGLEDEAPIGGSGRILVVEDQAAILRVLERVLTNAGYQVVSSARAEEALDVLARGTRLDLLITDLTLPGMNGLRLIEKTRAERPELPVLVMSGYAAIDDNEKDAQLLAELPALPKPFTPSQLLTKVYEILEAAREGLDDV